VEEYLALKVVEVQIAIISSKITQLHLRHTQNHVSAIVRLTLFDGAVYDQTQKGTSGIAAAYAHIATAYEQLDQIITAPMPLVDSRFVSDLFKLQCI
jgi:hypothetical protein